MRRLQRWSLRIRWHMHEAMWGWAIRGRGWRSRLVGALPEYLSDPLAHDLRGQDWSESLEWAELTLPAFNEALRNYEESDS